MLLSATHPSEAVNLLKYFSFYLKRLHLVWWHACKFLCVCDAMSCVEVRGQPQVLALTIHPALKECSVIVLYGVHQAGWFLTFKDSPASTPHLAVGTLEVEMHTPGNANSGPTLTQQALSQSHLPSCPLPLTSVVNKVLRQHSGEADSCFIITWKGMFSMSPFTMVLAAAFPEALLWVEKLVFPFKLY